MELFFKLNSAQEGLQRNLKKKFKYLGGRGYTV